MINVPARPTITVTASSVQQVEVFMAHLRLGASPAGQASAVVVVPSP